MNESMLDKKCEEQAILNDERLALMRKMAVDLKHLNQELCDMVTAKMDAIFGAIPANPEQINNTTSADNCLIDSTINELSIATEVCRKTLERIYVV